MLTKQMQPISKSMQNELNRLISNLGIRRLYFRLLMQNKAVMRNGGQICAQI